MVGSQFSDTNIRSENFVADISTEYSSQWDHLSPWWQLMQVFSWNVGKEFSWSVGIKELCFLLCLLLCTGTLVNILSFLWPLLLTSTVMYVCISGHNRSLTKYPPGEGKARHEASFWRVSLSLYQECGCHLIPLPENWQYQSNFRMLSHDNCKTQLRNALNRCSHGLGTRLPLERRSSTRTWSMC